VASVVNMMHTGEFGVNKEEHFRKSDIGSPMPWNDNTLDVPRSRLLAQRDGHIQSQPHRSTS
jgi:hypothetical protein